MKTCTKCNIEKELTCFYKRNNRLAGFTSRCKDCINSLNKTIRNPLKIKEYDLNKSYGIGLKEYEFLLKSQNFVCAICKLPVSKDKKKKYLCVDHCHKTNVIRGLLCDSCNRGLGLLKDNKEILQNAIHYINKP